MWNVECGMLESIRDIHHSKFQIDRFGSYPTMQFFCGATAAVGDTDDT
jgi:hypothetical protein